MSTIKTRLHQLAGLAIAAAVLTGCSRETMTQALPMGNEDGLLSNSSNAIYNRVPTGTVTGRVVDERTKMGVPGVWVAMQNVNPPVAGQTDQSGNFVLNNCPQGKQILQVNKVGYVYQATQGSILADVVAGTTISLAQVVLTPSINAASNAFITAIGGLVEPYGIAIDNNHGFLYAVDRIGLNSLVDKRCEVKKYNLGGGFVKRFGGDLFGFSKGNTNGGLFDHFTHLNWSYGIDVDAGGNLYVAEANKDRVVKFSSEGSFITSFGSGISNDYALTVLNNGQVAVSSAGNSKIVLFDVNLTASGSDFSATAGNPNANGGYRGITTDNANFIYVIDNSAGPGGAVKKFDSTNGRLVLQFGMNEGSGPGQFRGATTLAVDNRNGDVYVVDSGNNRVQRFDMDGRFVSEFGSAGRGVNQFDRPYGIALDKDGYIYISDLGNKRIQKFAPGRLFNNPTAFSGVNYPTK